MKRKATDASTRSTAEGNSNTERSHRSSPDTPVPLSLSPEPPDPPEGPFSRAHAGFSSALRTYTTAYSCHIRAYSWKTDLKRLAVIYPRDTFDRAEKMTERNNERHEPGPKPNDSKDRDRDTAVSPVIGVVLMVSITVLVASLTGALVSGSDFTDDVEEPTAGGVIFNYDYSPSSEKMRVSVQTPGNIERLFIQNKDGGFEDADIVETTGGWLNETAGRGPVGALTDGQRVVNTDVGAGDVLVLDNVTATDELVLTADRGSGTDQTLVSYWEDDNWSYAG